MGLDLLDFTFRMERRLQIRVRPQHLFLGQHTTVAEVVELLWWRLQGWEIQEDPEIIRLYHELHKRVASGSGRNVWEWMTGCPRKDRRLSEIIPADERVAFWEEYCRHLHFDLPPLTLSPDNQSPQFPDELSTQRQLLHFLRAQLLQRLTWVAIAAPADPQAPHKVWIPVKPWEFSWLGHHRYAVDPTLPRTEPWTREDLFEVVRDELVDTLGVDRDEVVPDAELRDDLGMD